MLPPLRSMMTVKSDSLTPLRTAKSRRVITSDMSRVENVR